MDPSATKLRVAKAGLSAAKEVLLKQDLAAEAEEAGIDALAEELVSLLRIPDRNRPRLAAIFAKVALSGEPDPDVDDCVARTLIQNLPYEMRERALNYVADFFQGRPLPEVVGDFDFGERWVDLHNFSWFRLFLVCSERKEGAELLVASKENVLERVVDSQDEWTFALAVRVWLLPTVFARKERFFFYDGGLWLTKSKPQIVELIGETVVNVQKSIIDKASEIRKKIAAFGSTPPERLTKRLKCCDTAVHRLSIAKKRGVSSEALRLLAIDDDIKFDREGAFALADCIICERKGNEVVHKKPSSANFITLSLGVDGWTKDEVSGFRDFFEKLLPCKSAREYLLRIFAAALFGAAAGDACFWLGGGDGRATLMKAAKICFGSYAGTLEAKTLWCTGKSQCLNRGIYDISKKRLVFAGATPDGDTWGRVKMLADTFPKIYGRLAHTKEMLNITFRGKLIIEADWSELPICTPKDSNYWYGFHYIRDHTCAVVFSDVSQCEIERANDPVKLARGLMGEIFRVLPDSPNTEPSVPSDTRPASILESTSFFQIFMLFGMGEANTRREAFRGAFAFLLAKHPRCGRNSPAASLCPFTMRKIAELAIRFAWCSLSEVAYYYPGRDETTGIFVPLHNAQNRRIGKQVRLVQP